MGVYNSFAVYGKQVFFSLKTQIPDQGAACYEHTAYQKGYFERDRERDILLHEAEQNRNGLHFYKQFV